MKTDRDSLSGRDCYLFIALGFLALICVIAAQCSYNG